MTHPHEDTNAELPAEQVSYAEAFKAFFPDGAPATNETPIAAAWQWWHALLAGRHTQAARLSANPADWGDFTAAAEDLGHFSLLQSIEYAPEQPNRIAYARFIPHTARPVRITEEAATNQGRWLTLVRRSERWYVWGLSDITFRPDPAMIFQAGS